MNQRLFLSQRCWLMSFCSVSKKNWCFLVGDTQRWMKSPGCTSLQGKQESGQDGRVHDEQAKVILKTQQGVCVASAPLWSSPPLQLSWPKLIFYLQSGKINSYDKYRRKQDLKQSYQWRQADWKTPRQGLAVRHEDEEGPEGGEKWQGRSGF